MCVYYVQKLKQFVTVLCVQHCIQLINTKINSKLKTNTDKQIFR